MKHIINKNNVDTTKQPLFFGEGLNLQRYDKYRYKKLFDLFLQQMSFFWRPEEVDLSGKEKNDFLSLTEQEKFIFTKNLSYQILLDSIQGRGISHLLDDCSNPELEAYCKSWEFFETIHSYSYTYIIKNVYPNPSDIFDEILTDKEVLKRTTSVTKYYDDLINSIGEKDIDSKKRKLYLTLVSINILEGIRFYVSFACTFAFAESKVMEGSAKIISLIARDEATHLNLSTHVIKNWLKGLDDPEMKKVAASCEEEVYDMWRTCVDEEKAWANYLFKDGAIIGLNEELLHHYVEFIANKRLKALGYKPLYDRPLNNNPLPWTQHWLSSSGLQVAPQETEVESYIVGGIKQDVDEDVLKGFTL